MPGKTNWLRGLVMLVAVAALAAGGTGCDSDAADALTAAVACGNACATVESCSITDCRSRCENLAGDETLLGSCTGCLLGATGADSCTVAESCIAAACDPGLIDAPECATFCATVSAACDGVRNCVPACTDLEDGVRADCIRCYDDKAGTCDGIRDCPQCGMTVVE